jgi:hypothetical protein
MFDILESNGLIKGARPNKKKLLSLKSKEIFDLARELSKPTQIIPQSTSVDTRLSHSASFSLAGAAEECSVMNCRLEKLDSLLRFAALYSDTVYIQNYFSDYQHTEDYDEILLRDNFIGNILCLLKAKPLIDKGLVKIYAFEGHMCADCIGDKIVKNEKHSGKKIQAAYKETIKEITSTLSMQAFCDGEYFTLNISAPDDVIEHGGVVLTQKFPFDFFAESKTLFKKVLKGEVVELSKSLIQKSGFGEFTANKIIENITYEAFLNSTLKTTFVTNRSSHIKFLSKISNNALQEDRNRIAGKYLQAIVPVAAEVDIEDIVKLRSRERDSFIRFRGALNKAIDEYYNRKKSFTEKEAKELYHDIIAPEISGLENKMKKASKDLINDSLRSAVGIVGSISFGMYSGILPPNWMAIAKTAGLLKFGGDFIKGIMSLGDGRNEIKTEDYYFLWKLRRLASAK